MPAFNLRRYTPPKKAQLSPSLSPSMKQNLFFFFEGLYWLVYLSIFPSGRLWFSSRTRSIKLAKSSMAAKNIDNIDNTQSQGPDNSIHGSNNPILAVSIEGSVNPSISRDQESNQSPDATQKPYTTHQKLTLVGMCCAYLFSMMSFSVIAPFFPLEVRIILTTPSGP